MIFSYLLNMQSHPSWVCGLKQVAYLGAILYQVTPFVGVWIETTSLYNGKCSLCHTLRGCVD